MSEQNLPFFEELVYADPEKASSHEAIGLEKQRMLFFLKTHQDAATIQQQQYILVAYADQVYDYLASNPEKQFYHLLAQAFDDLLTYLENHRRNYLDLHGSIIIAKAIRLRNEYLPALQDIISRLAEAGIPGEIISDLHTAIRELLSEGRLWLNYRMFFYIEHMKEQLSVMLMAVQQSDQPFEQLLYFLTRINYNTQECFQYLIATMRKKLEEEIAVEMKMTVLYDWENLIRTLIVPTGLYYISAHRSLKEMLLRWITTERALCERQMQLVEHEVMRFDERKRNQPKIHFNATVEQIAKKVFELVREGILENEDALLLLDLLSANISSRYQKKLSRDNLKNEYHKAKKAK